MPCPHTSEVICEALYKSLQNWNLDCKLSTLTLDNCSTNDKLVEAIETKVGPSNLLLGGKMLHMRCCAHILNLIVKDGLSVMEHGIKRVRDSVSYWTATPKRYEKFVKAARFVKVELTKKIGLDCKTRWNSTYVMLSTAIPYMKVFERLKQLDMQFNCAPTVADWNFASTVCEKLSVFYELTEMFSGTKYVTANIFFPKICEVKMHMNKWLGCGDPIIEAMSVEMIKKFDKYWSDIHGLMAIAIIIDPRGKMTMLHACYIALFGEENSEENVTKSYNCLCELMNEYQVHSKEEGMATSSSTSVAIGSNEVLSIFKTLAASKKSTGVVKTKSELDRYLEEETLPCTNEEFDILSWWKVAGTRYPTLRKIARDILAIPITTVASESAFSTSGRVLSEHRSRLTPAILEALMCSQSWLRNDFKGMQLVM